MSDITSNPRVNRLVSLLDNSLLLFVKFLEDELIIFPKIDEGIMIVAFNAVLTKSSPFSFLSSLFVSSVSTYPICNAFKM